MRANPEEQILALALHSGSVLLSTAQVMVLDKIGHTHYAKALLNSGSMPSSVTDGLLKRLNEMK